MMTAVPCYAVLVAFGVRSLIADARWRTAVLTLILLVIATDTYSLLTGPYEAGMLRRWATRAGLRETLATVRSSRDPGEQAFLEWPGLRYEDWLYVQSLANFEVTAVDHGTIVGMAQGNGQQRALFISRDAADGPQIDRLQRQGFGIAGEVQDPPGGRCLVVLAKHLPGAAPAP